MEKDNLKLLITGVSGLLGNNLAHYFKDKYEVTGLYSSHPVVIRGIRTEKCDLLYDDSIGKIISDINPSIIIHCASMTNIDQCEIDKNLTEKINVAATKNIINSITDKDIRSVYISTDAVYDGVKGDFSEDDDIDPLNYYGLSKHEGELQVLKKEHSLILRTNIFGWNIQDKKSIGEWILGELIGRRKISGFKDTYFSSIYTMELARVIDIAIQNNMSGVYNCGSQNSCSKYEFAVKMAERFGLDKTLITPISIDDFNFKAKRGKNLSLNVNKLQTELDYNLPTIDQSIDAFYRDYKCGVSSQIKKGLNLTQAKRDYEVIPYGRQWIDENDIQSVVNVLRSDWITQGPKVDEFEKALAEYCGARYAVAVNSATSALYLACIAAGIESSNEVITSPITFIASANSVVYCNAKPVFADIDSRTYNINPAEIEKKINIFTKAVIPVHFAGQSCDMEYINDVIQKKEIEFKHKIFIIEDACHALGSIYKGHNVGCCEFSDMTVMSFHPVKHITTGEGGVVFTNDEILYKKLRRLRSHGVTNNLEEFVYNDRAFEASEGGAQPLVKPWYYEQIDLGYNFRITDIQCALGLSQLKKLEVFREVRRKIVNRYNEAFSNISSIQIPFEAEYCESNFHLYVLLFDFDKLGMMRAHFMKSLKLKGIQTQVHYIPVQLQPFYQRHFGTKSGDCPNAERYYKRCLSIPLFPAMTDDNVQKVIEEVTAISKGQAKYFERHY